MDLSQRLDNIQYSFSNNRGLRHGRYTQISSAVTFYHGFWTLLVVGSGTDIATHKLGVGFSQRSLHIKPQPLLGSHLFGPRLIDIGSDELVQRPDDLVVLVGTTLGSFAG